MKMHGLARFLLLALLVLSLHACSDDQKTEGKANPPHILPYLA
jgi:uncharacterized lipoprotein